MSEADQNNSPDMTNPQEPEAPQASAEAPPEKKVEQDKPAEQEKPVEQEKKIGFDTWDALDLRVAEVVEAEAHPNADKLLVLQVDLGAEKRQIVAGIRGHYDPETLVGRKIVVLTNLKPAKLRGVESRGMLLAASGEGKEVVSLLTIDKDVPPGAKIS